MNKKGFRLEESIAVMIVQELPREVIIELLLRLPVKSLVRFKSVSKSWFFMISSCSFSRWHLNRVNDSISDSIIVCSGHDSGYRLHSIGGGSKDNNFEESTEIDLPMIHGKNNLMKCSCDGMLCMAIGDDTLVLWNPSIRVNKRLPLPPLKKIHAYRDVFGFGYDTSIGDYKVVSFHSKHGLQRYSVPCPYPVYVLTLRTNLWKKVGDVSYNISPVNMAIPVNGGLHWPASLDRGRPHLILCFDLAKEIFREVAMPPLEGLERDLFKLGHLKGSLCVFRNCALWVMKEEGEIWSKIIHIQPQNSSGYLRPLCFTKSGKVLLDLGQGQIVMYDPKGETSKKLDNHDHKNWWSQITVYTESLISPSGSGMEDID